MFNYENVYSEECIYCEDCKKLTSTISIYSGHHILKEG